MTQPSIDTSLVRFVDMAKNPVPFNPITYEDRAKKWLDLEVPLNNMRVKDIINNGIDFGDEKKKRILTERYAVIQIDNEDDLISGKDWKIFNRVATDEGSWSAPAFFQLCTRLRSLTGLTTDEIKSMVTPRHDGKDEFGKWKWTDSILEAIRILNTALSRIQETRTLWFNPEKGRIESIVSGKYAPITNKEVLTLLQAEIGDFDIVREFHNERRSLFQVLPDKFAGMSNSEDYGVFIENSSTGANRIGMGMFTITGACSNGMMVVASKYGQTSYLARRHFGNKEDIIKLIQDYCADIGERIEETHKKIELAKNTPLRGEDYSEEYLVDNFLKPLAEVKKISKPTISRVEELLKEKYKQDTVWDFISAMTEAAHEVPATSREHIEKIAGDLLEILVPA